VFARNTTRERVDRTIKVAKNSENNISTWCVGERYSCGRRDGIILRIGGFAAWIGSEKGETRHAHDAALLVSRTYSWKKFYEYRHIASYIIREELTEEPTLRLWPNTLP